MCGFVTHYFQKDHTGYIDVNVVLLNLFAGRLLGT